MKRKKKIKKTSPRPIFEVIGDKVWELEQKLEASGANPLIEAQIEQLVNKLDFEQVLMMDEYIQKISKKNF